jgi:high-affinity iron transporter
MWPLSSSCLERHWKQVRGGVCFFLVIKQSVLSFWLECARPDEFVLIPLVAAIIISVLLQLLVKIKLPELKKWVWLGAGAGLIISFIFGLIFVLLFYVANTKFLSAQASDIFKGVVSWIAAMMVAYVAFALLKFYNLERKWRHKLKDAVDRQAHIKNHRWSMFLLAGSATLREGIESVLFLTGVTAGSSVKSVVIPGIIGILLGALLGVIVYYTGRSIRSLKWFFIPSAIILLLIGGAMVINGTSYLQNAGLFGALWPYEMRPWCNLIVWDATSCCDPNTNEFWSLLRSLFGWQAEPTNLQLLYYGLYWLLILILVIYKYFNGTLTDAKLAAKLDQESFARHALEDAKDASETSSDKLDSKDSSLDLESGKAVQDNVGEELDDGTVHQHNPAPEGQLAAVSVGDTTVNAPKHPPA